MNHVLSLIFFLVTLNARSQSIVSGDSIINGRLGIGLTPTNTRFAVRMSTESASIFQVSDGAGSPLFVLMSSGALGVGVLPTAGVDVMGIGDNESSGLGLRGGGSAPSTGIQLTLGFDGSSNLRHAIGSSHSTAAAGNGVHFFLWSPAVSTTSVGTLDVASLVMTSTFGYVHVMPPSVQPSTASPVELVVSNGAIFGGGDVLRRSEGSHSSRDIKTDIVYLGRADEDAALGDVASLRHVSFRYAVIKSGRPHRDPRMRMRRGLVFEEAPPSIRSGSYGISVDERIVNAELALKALIRSTEKLRENLELEKREGR